MYGSAQVGCEAGPKHHCPRCQRTSGASYNDVRNRSPEPNFDRQRGTARRAGSKDECGGSATGRRHGRSQYEGIECDNPDLCTSFLIVPVLLVVIVIVFPSVIFNLISIILFIFNLI